MCYVVPLNVTREIHNVMFPKDLIHGISYSTVSPFKGLGAQFLASHTCVISKLHNMNVDCELI